MAEAILYDIWDPFHAEALQGVKTQQKDKKKGQRKVQKTINQHLSRLWKTNGKDKLQGVFQHTFISSLTYLIFLIKKQTL